MSNKPRKPKKMNRQRVIHSVFKQATKGSYTMYGCCIKEPVMTQVAIDPRHLPRFKKWVANTPFIWKTWMCVFARNQLGEKYTKIEIHETPKPMASDEASDYMSEKLYALIRSINTSHLISSGYVNTYNEADLHGSSDDLLDMFESYGTFDEEHCMNLHAKNLIRTALEKAA